MTKQDELSMLRKILDELNNVPDDYRSQNHTQYLREVEFRIYELYEEINGNA